MICFPEGYRFEDMLWTPHVLEKCKKAVFVPYVVYHYCFNDNSITNSVYDSKKMKLNMQLNICLILYMKILCNTIALL